MNEYQSNKKKPGFGSALTFLLLFAVGCISGYAIGHVVGSLVADNIDSSGQLPMMLFLACISFIAAFAIQIIIHETGHLFFGLLSGYRFSSFRIGSLIWINDSGKIRLKRFSLAGTAGQCLLDPPDMRDSKIPFVLYNLGGVIFNLIAAAIATVGYFLLRDATIPAIICLALAVAGFADALTNGIPLKTNMISNDGHNALSLGKDAAALHAFWVQMKVNVAQIKGTRLKDMPPAWFQVPDDDAMKNAMVATIGVFVCNRLMDEHRFEEADGLMTHMLTADIAVVGIYRHAMICDRLYCELIGENRKEVIDAFLDKAQKSFIKSMKTHPSILRTDYAYALLYEKNAAKAAKIKAQFNKVGKTYPYPGDFESERELLEIVDKKV